jgi:hypothetical protein
MPEGFEDDWIDAVLEEASVLTDQTRDTVPPSEHGEETQEWAVEFEHGGKIEQDGKHTSFSPAPSWSVIHSTRELLAEEAVDSSDKAA